MIHVIVNPAGAGGKTGRYWEKKIQPLLEGTEYQLHLSTEEGAAERICAELSSFIPEGETVRILILGGDGTINAAVNGIRDFEHTQLGLIPCGSGNDLARDLHFPEDPAELVRRILSGQTVRQVDVGECIWNDTGKSRFFVVSAGAGFDAAVCHYAQISVLKRFLNRFGLGKLVYILEAIRLIFSYKPSVSDLIPGAVSEADSAESGEKTGKQAGEKPVHYDRFIFAAGMNHRFEGGGFMMCPKAKDDDGELDYCIVHDLSVLDFFRFFPSATSGGHVRQKAKVAQLRKKSLRVRSDRPLWVHCDGETGEPSADVLFRISRNRLNLLI